jgi:hypothetical protein
MSAEHDETPATDANCWRETSSKASECVTVDFARKLERLLRDTFEYAQHDRRCPVARGVDEACDCGFRQIEERVKAL